MQEEDAINHYVDELRRVTSSENNALILEKLLYDECSRLEISSHEIYHDDFSDDVDKFVVREGDDMHSLGYYIGKSTRLESLTLYHMPLNNFFRDGIAFNKSIQELFIFRDLGEEGFRCLAPFFRNTNTLEELTFSARFICTESMRSFALLLGQCQIKSLKQIDLKEIQFGDSEYTELARALSMQPQLEILSLAHLYGGDNDTSLGRITLGNAMKHWKSPCLKVLEIYCCHIDDDGMLALVEGLANCTYLESLDFGGNNTITEVGLRALSSLFQSKKFLQSVDLSYMNVTDDGMTVLAPGLASLKSLRRLHLSDNSIGDVGLKALAAARPDFHHFEYILLHNNAGFSAVGLKALSSVLQTVSSLEYLNLGNNSIDDEGLQAFITEMKEQCTIERLKFAHNAISSGVRILAGMTSLRRLYLEDNNIGDNDEAMEALVEAMESLCNLENLKLSKVTSSGLSILATVLQSDRCYLQELDLGGTRLEDSGAIALANGLKVNKLLTKVYFGHRSLTDVGWSAIERLLCDTSSVNNTYCSNHILERIGGSSYADGYPASIESLLDLNKIKCKGVNVPICKILMSHSDIDMTPLLQWKLKLLPFVVAWFERARSSQPIQSRIALTGRKLSAMYQFIGGTSHSVVEGYAHSMKRTGARSSRKRKINQCEE